jgi:carbamoyl-phosphate synthase small subunit
VSAETLPPEVEVTHINLNDQCVEGMRHRTLPVISVQYHPEAAPGPHDAEHHFVRFVKLMDQHASPRHKGQDVSQRRTEPAT